MSITVRSRDADPDGTSRECAGFKDDLTNYRLNSSILVIRSVSVWPSKPTILGDNSHGRGDVDENNHFTKMKCCDKESLCHGKPDWMLRGLCTM